MVGGSISGTVRGTGNHLLARPLAKGTDIVPLNSQSNMLQFRAGGHILGFQPTRAYLASLDHALSVEFLHTKGVMPQSTNGASDTHAPAKAPALTKVSYANLWKGISLTYETAQDGITESTYHIAPGADVSQIRLRYNVPVKVQKDGSLKFTFERGYLTESKPVAWQDINGKRIPVTVAFNVSGDEVGFSVGTYNPREPLIIDPTYAWHTFYGASNDDYGRSIAVDTSGNIYITGSSNASWGTPINAHSGTLDIFVLKLNGSGSYQWHTFYGSSSGDEGGEDIAVDTGGNIHVTGWNTATWGSPLHAYSGYYDIFVLKLIEPACSPPVKVNTAYFNTVQDAYNAAANGSTVQISGQVFTEDVSLTRNITTIFSGGYDCEFAITTGYSTVDGSFTIKDGSVTVEGLIIK
jgi:hypothetical protein